MSHMRDREPTQALASVLMARAFDELWILTTLLLAEAPLSGLELAHRVYVDTRFTLGDTVMADGYRIPRGRLYKILNQLMGEGHIQVTVETDDGDEGHSGRRKGYRITSDGREYYAAIREERSLSVMGGRRMLETLERRVTNENLRPLPQNPGWNRSNY